MRASERIEVAAGLVFRNGKLLITQRPAAAHLGGLWEFPGGKREPEETFEECLHRELKEELGIEVDVNELVETVTHDYAEKSVTLNFYRCAWKAHEPRALGCLDFRWIAPDELAHYQFPDADVKLVEVLTHRTELWL